MSGEVDDLITYLVVICNEKTYVAAAELVTHIQGLQETVKFLLKVRRFNVITYTQKSRNYVAASTVLVTVLPCKLSQEPMCLAP